MKLLNAFYQDHSPETLALFETPEIKACLAFAERKHTGQIRKYTGEPYINHPYTVAMDAVEALSREFDGFEHLILFDVARIALLHDTVEDTDTTYQELAAEFGEDIMLAVSELTDQIPHNSGNRKYRKIIRAHQLANCNDFRAQAVKLFDLYNNTGDILVHDPAFGSTFQAEADMTIERLLCQRLNPLASLMKQVHERIMNQPK